MTSAISYNTAPMLTATAGSAGLATLLARHAALTLEASRADHEADMDRLSGEADAVLHAIAAYRAEHVEDMRCKARYLLSQRGRGDALMEAELYEAFLRSII